MSLTRTIESLKNCILLAATLEDDYEGKTKGSIYYRRKDILLKRFRFYTIKLKQLGQGQVCLWHVTLSNGKVYLIYYSGEFSENEVKTMIELDHGPQAERISLIKTINLGILETVI